jgi:hypothetical protein
MATWTNPEFRKDANIEPMDNYMRRVLEADDEVSNMGFDANPDYEVLDDGRDFDEILISGGDQISDIFNKGEVAAVKEVTGEDTPSISDTITELRERFEIAKFRGLIKNLFESFPKGLSKVKRAIAALIVGFYYKQKDANTSEAKTARNIIERQIQMYFTLPITFWVAINWWYVWNYTNFTFNFMDLLAIPLFSPLYYVLEPPVYMLEIINYYFLTMRMDQNLSCTYRAVLTALWDWRPVTFTIFALSLAGALQNLPFSDTIASVITGESNPISAIVFLGTIGLFFYLTCTCMKRLLEFNKLFSNVLIVAFMMLLFFLFVLIFAGIASGIAVMYIAFFSSFVLIVFERFNFIVV